MLEEMGYVVSCSGQDAQGRKLHGLDFGGRKGFLAGAEAAIDAIFARLGDGDLRFASFVSVKRAMLNLRPRFSWRLLAATPALSKCKRSSTRWTRRPAKAVERA